MSQIDICLATYNGARFLSEQLASLCQQTHRDWRLLVRDDGSSDATLDIVREWSKTVSQPVEIIDDGRSGLGASLNFSTLLEHVTADYFACCDQDDVWLPQKLELMLRELKTAEDANGSDAPLLAFCDLEVVGEDLSPLSPSYWQLSNLNPDLDIERLIDLMVRNVVTGCATLGNAALLREALPVAQWARMHDWWLAMTAQALGQLVPVRQPLIRYRQHQSNTIGANKADTMGLVVRFGKSPAAAWQRTIESLDQTQAQAGAFVERFGPRLKPHDAAVLSDYSQLAEQSWLTRKRFLWRHRIAARQPLFRLAMLIVG